MFPQRPRRPIQRFARTPYSIHPYRPRRASSRLPILGDFQHADGNLDFNKLTTTGKQIMDLYGQFSPLISRFIKR
ncbi:YppG family protein [Ornithinibacillus contaminans]|uniref:YppG family protein n=1 Tax=Ornithinibacillus contaminans TaxID=694055 RepID=UPI00064D8BCA